MAKIKINGTSMNFGDIGGNVNVVSRDGNIIINGQVVSSGLSGTVKLEVEDAVINSIEADGSVICGNVSGNVSAGGSVTCENVTGNASAGGSVRAGKVMGAVNAGGSVRIGA